MEANQIAARWDAEEKSVRARLLAADAAPQEQIAGRAGMEMFEAIFAGELLSFATRIAPPALTRLIVKYLAR